jgi:hypothetical protein
MKPRDLEELALTTWPASQQWLYDGWVVRFADGHTRRANSVNPLYPSLQDAAAKIMQCEQWYAERNLPTVFRLNSYTAPVSLDQLLDVVNYICQADAFEIAAEVCGAAEALPTEAEWHQQQASTQHTLGGDRGVGTEPDGGSIHLVRAKNRPIAKPS